MEKLYLHLIKNIKAFLCVMCMTYTERA